MKAMILDMCILSQCFWMFLLISKQETLPQKPWFRRGTAAQRKVPSMVFGEFMSGENFNDTGARLVFGWGPGNSNGPWWPWVKDVKVKLYIEALGFQVSWDVHRNMICWLVVWNMNGLFSHILGMSSSQLTNSYFSEGCGSTTNQVWCDITNSNRKEQYWGMVIPPVQGLIYSL